MQLLHRLVNLPVDSIDVELQEYLFEVDVALDQLAR
jgi:hypothetical protein